MDRHWKVGTGGMLTHGHPSETSDTETDIRILNGGDRCDACGAQASVLVIMQGERQLLFCGHHWRRHRVAIQPLVIDVVDETDFDH